MILDFSIESKEKVYISLIAKNKNDISEVKNLIIKI